MRWFRIRKAKIANKDREEFEQFGVVTIQSMLASGNLSELKNDFPIGGAPLSSRSTLSLIQFELFQKKPAALAWLVEPDDLHLGHVTEVNPPFLVKSDLETALSSGAEPV